MPYIKTNWASATITPDNFNKMQTQYQEAVEDAIGVRIDNSELRCEIVSDFPAHRMGRIIFHTGLKSFFFSTGSAWHMEPIKTDFGNAQLGSFTSTGNVAYTNTIGGTVVRNYRNFTLSSGHTLTMANPGRLLLIRAWGNIIINGTINMNYKGGYGDRYLNLFGTTYDLIGGDGGNGGDGSNATGNGGTANLNHSVAGGRKGGGGGGGGSGGGQGGGKNAGSASGASTTSFNMAQAIGGYPAAQVLPGINGLAGQGATGEAEARAWSASNSISRAVSASGVATVNAGASGGGGDVFVYDDNITRQSAAGTQGVIGGGVVILLAMGTVSVNGQILARGGTGGNGAVGLHRSNGVDYEGQNGGGAGGSGGGRVLVAHQQGYNLSGSINVNGGTGGNGGTGPNPGDNGSPGSNGNIDVVQLT